MPAALGPRCARFVGEAAADRVLQAAQIAQGQLQQEHLSVVLPAPDSGCTHKLFMYVCVLLPRALCVCVCRPGETRSAACADTLCRICSFSREFLAHGGSRPLELQKLEQVNW